MRNKNQNRQNHKSSNQNQRQNRHRNGNQNEGQENQNRQAKTQERQERNSAGQRRNKRNEPTVRSQLAPRDQATEITHKISVAGLAKGLRAIAHLVTKALDMTAKVCGLGRIGGLATTKSDDEESKLSITVRPTPQHAANGQGGYTKKVAARKPNLFTFLGKDEQNNWTATLDTRFSDLNDPWVAVTLFKLTELMERKMTDGMLVGALTLPGSEKTSYQSVMLTREVLRVIGKAIAENATPENFRETLARTTMIAQVAGTRTQSQATLAQA